ncbi:synaptic vesicle glycoprotein 2A-like [Amphiura filiformis]|uniref:synaptic vesicle glycoprotein 2A-like n=1 Tax=Amphiura filiformis TaxID=82378 RepID=UPI003B214B96
MSSEEEEYDVFAISRAAGDSRPKRTSQTSQFGAVDENVNVQFIGDDDDEVTERSESSQGAGGGYHAGAAPYVEEEGNERRAAEFEEGDIDESSASQLAEVADRLITDAGYRLCVYGIKNVKFVLTVGLGLFYAGIQAVITSLLVPDIARDLCLRDAETGWIRIIVLIGIAFGAFIQGCISDLTARRPCLIASLMTAGIFGAIAGVLPQSHASLLFCLALNGFGIGGILAIAVPYYTELLPSQGCGRQITSFLVFIITGVAFISLVVSEFSTAIPTLCSGYCFSNWRITCLSLSVLPCLSALMIYLAHIPESPRLLMEHREWTKAIEILTHIYTESHNGDDGETFKYKANELYRIGRQTRRSKPPPAPSTLLQRIGKKISSFFKNIADVLRKPIGQYTDRLIICGCAFAFGYGGWALWLPDYIKAADIISHRSHDSNITRTTISNTNYTDSLESTQFHNVTMRNVQFYDVFLSDVHFINSIIQNCNFDNVVSEGVSFSNCKIISSTFGDTDFSARLFYDSKWVNSSFEKKTSACSSDEPFAPTMAYYKLFLSHIGGIVGVFVASFVVSIIGSRFMFIGSCVATTIVVFCMLALSTSISATVVFLFLQLTGMVTWSALCVHTMLLYPTGKRGTALGLFITMTTLCCLLGLGVVAELPIKTSEVAQTIVTSLIILIGGILMWTMPCVKDELIR